MKVCRLISINICDCSNSYIILSKATLAPRDSLYKDYIDEEMRLVRFKEQRKAAVVGEFAAQIMLDIPSKVIKGASHRGPGDDILAILHATQPKFVYTHNLADKHDTHVAVALRVIEALRKLDQAERPERVVGCEVWRALDWMVDSDKVMMDLSGHENLQFALLGVFDSQIAGGKRYDLASMGRRRANATYWGSHGVDETTGLSYGMDMTPLMHDVRLKPVEFVGQFIERFAMDVQERVMRNG